MGSLLGPWAPLFFSSCFQTCVKFGIMGPFLGPGPCVSHASYSRIYLWLVQASAIAYLAVFSSCRQDVISFQYSELVHFTASSGLHCFSGRWTTLPRCFVCWRLACTSVSTLYIFRSGGHWCWDESSPGRRRSVGHWHRDESCPGQLHRCWRCAFVCISAFILCSARRSERWMVSQTSFSGPWTQTKIHKKKKTIPSPKKLKKINTTNIYFFFV